ncbi:MAG: hypothetical protein QM606_01325 [Leucobacter sp.]
MSEDSFDRSRVGARAVLPAAVLPAALLAASLAIGLGGCGAQGDPGSQGAGERTASEAAPDTAESGSSPSAAGEEAVGEEASSDEPSGSDELPAGEPLPDDWPADILVPEGSIVLVLPMGGGYALTVEGVDDDQARELIAEMASSGLATEGPVDLGNGEWTASATSGTHQATYAYAEGGAGLPNVSINLSPLG